MKTRTHRAERSAGFTLLETMMSMAIMTVASLGALAAMGHSGSELRQGQVRQSRSMLSLESSQKMMLAAKAVPSLTVPGKTALAAAAQAMPTTRPDLLAIGAAPWAPDASGAYFSIVPNGEVVPVTGIAPGTACNANTLPSGIYCRETLITVGMPVALGSNAALLPSGMSAYTYWVRISRAGEPLSSAVVNREVFVQ